MTDRRTAWLLFALSFSLIVAVTMGMAKLSAAEREAAQHEATAMEMERQREATEVLLHDLTHSYTEQGDSLERLRQAVASTTAAAQQARELAAVASDSLTALLGAQIESASPADTILQALSEAHADEVYALEVQLSVVMTENGALWRRLETADALISQHVAANELLRLEIVEWRAAYDALGADRFPSFFGKLKANVEVAAVGVVTGAVACLAFCR